MDVFGHFVSMLRRVLRMQFFLKAHFSLEKNAILQQFPPTNSLQALPPPLSHTHTHTSQLLAIQVSLNFSTFLFLFLYFECYK